MTSCPECESQLDIDVEEVEEGDVVACGECGTEYEIVGVEPLEWTPVAKHAGSGSSIPETPAEPTVAERH